MDLYQQVFRNTYQFTGILDLEGILLDANEAALNFIMKKKEDVIGRYFWDTEWWAHDPALQEELKESIARIKVDKSHHRFEVTHPRHDNHISAFDFSLSPLIDEDGIMIYIIAEGRDISQVKEAERDREFSEIRYRDLFRNSKDAYLIIEEDKFIEFNPATVEMLGFKSESELLGVHPSELSPEYQPDGRLSYEKANEMMHIAYTNGTNRFEWLHKKADGTEFPVEVLLTAIRQGDHTLLFTVWRDITVQKANEEKIIRMNQDLEARITERTKALSDSLKELEKAQNMIIESKKLASLGQLIIGISHEMNTPLGTAITGVSYLNNLVKDIKSSLELQADTERQKAIETIDDVFELTGQINRSLDHAASLIDHFKSLSIVPLEDRLSEVNLYELIKAAALPFNKEMNLHNHRLNVDIPRDYRFKTHPLTLGNIISQLISNALFHGFENSVDGQMTIAIEEENTQVKIIFTDNGKGLNQEELDRIFDPFFTTHRGTGKSGLGMNIVYNQVHQILHGEISVMNKEGEPGCRIIIAIPTKA